MYLRRGITLLTSLFCFAQASPIFGGQQPMEYHFHTYSDTSGAAPTLADLRLTGAPVAHLAHPAGGRGMSSYFPDRSQDGFGPYPPAAPPKFNGHIMQETGGNHVSSYFPDLSLDGSGPYPPANRQHLHPKPPAVNIHALIPAHGAAPLPHKLAHSKIPFKTFGAHKHALHPAPPLPPYHAPPKLGPHGPPHQTHYHVHSLAPSQMYYMAKSKPIPMEMMHMLPFDQKVVNMDLLTGLTHGAKGLLGVLVNGISSATNLVHGASTKLLGGVATGSQLLQTVIETVKDRLGAKMMMPGDMAAGMQAAAAGPYPPARPGAPVYGPPHH